MSLKSFQKFSKSALTGLGNKVAIQNFKRNLPKTEDAYPEELTFPEITDRETITNKMIMHVIKDDTSRAAMNVKEKLKELKTFSYVNDIKPKEVIETKNIAEEYNKRFQIKKVEGHKNSIRVGLLGYKVGMTGAWDKWGTWFPLTVIKVENCQVTQVKTKEGPDGYDALQVGVGQKDSTKMTKGMIGHYIKNDLSLKRHVREFRITPENNLPIGYMLSVRHFVPGQLVDVKGISKGKGWQGVMVRWNFGGGFATHGCSLKHRQTVKC